MNSTGVKEFKLCFYDGCDKLTTRVYCRAHSKKYNICAYEGCGRRCRKVYCQLHRPELMEKKREYSKDRYYKMRDLALLNYESNH